jgi:hypothetical protein
MGTSVGQPGVTLKQASATMTGMGTRLRPQLAFPGGHGTSLGNRGAFLDGQCASPASIGLSLANMRATLAVTMAKHAKRSVQLIMIDAQRALGMTQREFGYAVGASHRTAVRWAARQSTPSEGNLRKVAGLLHLKHPALAAEVADYIDETLVSLGLEAPPPPPPAPLPLPAPSPPKPPEPPPVRPEDLVDILVLAAVQTTGAAPGPMRALLHTVFKRAKDVGLTVESAEAGLRVGVAGATGVRGELGLGES